MKTLLRKLWALPVIAFVLSSAAICASLIYVFAILKLILPFRLTRPALTHTVVFFAQVWARCNQFVGYVLLPNIKWTYQGLDGLSPHKNYLILSNHTSGVDILALFQALTGKTPFFRFFLKKELIWVPIFGLAWWALDYPFMKRFSKEYLEKHPEKKGEDLETTRRSVQKFVGQNISIVNYVEGTRNTPGKSVKTKSPFKHLLRPKAGGASYVLELMGDQFFEVLDVTVAYPSGPATLWKYYSGQVPEIFLKVDRIPVPKELTGSSPLSEQQKKVAAQNWVNEIWERKDLLLDKILVQPTAPSKP